MKRYIEYYITEWRCITREFDDEQVFNDAKNAFSLQKGKSIAFTDSEGNDIIIPIDKVILIRCYEENADG